MQSISLSCRLPIRGGHDDFVELRFKPGTWEAMGIPECGCWIQTSTLDRAWHDSRSAGECGIGVGAAHGADGDTVETAAADTGLPADKLQEIVGHLGGEGSLGQFASLLQSDGSAGGIMGKLSGLFGSKE